tara:strand:+ start:1850 stop:2269 length:420 start_codon:yes stop_codon:yes gene_type:complete
MALKPIKGKDTNLSRAFKDIKVDFASNPFTKDVSQVTNDNSIKQSLKNLVMTQPGEKLFQPQIGSGVRRLLFEPMDAFTADAIRDDILNTVGQHEPRISIRNIAVREQYDQNQFNVTINYAIVGQPLIEEVAFVLKRPE